MTQFSLERVQPVVALAESFDYRVVVVVGLAFAWLFFRRAWLRFRLGLCLGCRCFDCILAVTNNFGLLLLVRNRFAKLFCLVESNLLFLKRGNCFFGAVLDNVLGSLDRFTRDIQERCSVGYRGVNCPLDVF